MVGRAVNKLNPSPPNQYGGNEAGTNRNEAELTPRDLPVPPGGGKGKWTEAEIPISHNALPLKWSHFFLKETRFSCGISREGSLNG